jgi:L-rhamnose isomerase
MPGVSIIHIPWPKGQDLLTLRETREGAGAKVLNEIV